MSTDLELQSHFARYICVLVSGFIETSVQHILSRYASRHSSEEVASAVAKSVGRFQNAKAGSIVILLRTFSTEWGDKFEKAIEGEKHDAIDSVVGNRHQIAHGKHVGLSLVQMRSYYKPVILSIEYLENMLSG